MGDNFATEFGAAIQHEFKDATDTIRGRGRPQVA